MWHPKIIRTCPLAVHALLLLTVVLNTTTRSDELKRSESPQTLVLSEDGGWGYAGRHAQVAQNRLFYSYLDQEGISWVASFDFETGQLTQTPLGKGVNDLHSSNPLFIRPDGRIQVFLDRGIWNWSRDGQERQRAVWSDIVADADGRPFVTFAVQDAAPRGQSQLHEGYWATPNAEGQWHFHHVATLARGWDNTPERKNLAIAIDPHDPHAVFLARSTSEADDLSQIQRMVTRDGGARWDTADVLSEEGRLTTVVIPQVLDDSRREVDVLWLEGRMEGWRSYATQVVARRMAAPE